MRKTREEELSPEPRLELQTTGQWSLAEPLISATATMRRQGLPDAKGSTSRSKAASGHLLQEGSKRRYCRRRMRSSSPSKRLLTWFLPRPAATYTSESTTATSIAG